MRKQTLSSLIQITTGLAVVAGLALVIWELRQSREVAIAQLTSDGYGIGMQRTVAALGENPANALAKACENPEQIASDELVILDAHFQALVHEIMRAYRIEQRSGLYEGTWRQIAQGGFRDIFSTSVGRGWWHQEKGSLPLEVQQLGVSVLEAVNESVCWLHPWRVSTRDETVESTK